MKPAGGLHLGIDAINIRAGGGLTHLSSLLEAASPEEQGFSHVSVWCSRATASRLPTREWLTVHSPPWSEGGLVVRTIGKQILLPRAFGEKRCDVVFCPGGIVGRNGRRPTITMSQNMLPFQPEEANRFGRWSATRARFAILNLLQTDSFERADGVIFLTEYAEATIAAKVPRLSCRRARVPHGVEKLPENIDRSSWAGRALQPEGRNLRALYVSQLTEYKHQVEVVAAIWQLRQEGLQITAEFVGAALGKYGRKVRGLLARLDPEGQVFRWQGAVAHERIREHYASTDLVVFASSCENLPITLLEAMAAGLPIACSEREPMPEILGQAGVYFEPTSAESIARAVRTLANDEALRARLGSLARARAAEYSWTRCARETFGFIAEVAGATRARGDRIARRRTTTV